MILQLLSALAQTLVLPSSHRPASCIQTFLPQEVHLLSALAQTVLLQSRSRPVSLNQSITDPSLQQGALVQTLLLLRASRPASLALILTDLPVCLLKGPVLPSPTLPSQTDRPKSALTTGSGSPTLQKASRRDSISSLESEADSDLSDRPPV